MLLLHRGREKSARESERQRANEVTALLSADQKASPPSPLSASCKTGPLLSSFSVAVSLRIPIVWLEVYNTLRLDAAGALPERSRPATRAGSSSEAPWERDATSGGRRLDGIGFFSFRAALLPSPRRLRWLSFSQGTMMMLFVPQSLSNYRKRKQKAHHKTTILSSLRCCIKTVKNETLFSRKKKKPRTLPPPPPSIKKKMTDSKPATAGAWATAKPFVNGGLSGMAATTIIQPIDMVKVRLQLGASGGPVRSFRALFFPLFPFFFLHLLRRNRPSSD